MNRKNILVTVACLLLAVSAVSALLASRCGVRDLPDEAEETVSAAEVRVSCSDVSASDAEPEPVHPPEIKPLDGVHAEALDAIAEKYGCVSVQLAVIDDGYVVSSYCRGYSDSHSKTEMNDGTKIHTASLTKAAVAMAAMKAQDDGVFDLDDPVSDLLDCKAKNPYYPDHVLTMRDFLTHTASISGDVEMKDPLRTLFGNAKTYAAREPGSAAGWRYSNEGMRIAGAVIETMVEQTLDEYTSEKLFEPIGITAAFYPSTLEDKSNIACLYDSSHRLTRSVGQQLADGYSSVPGNNRMKYSGGLTVSTVDFAKLMCVLLRDGEYDGKQILSPEAVAELQEVNFRLGDFDQCVILRHKDDMYGGRSLFYHSGSSYGALTLASYDEEANEGVVVMTIGADASGDAFSVPAVCGEYAEYAYTSILGGE